MRLGRVAALLIASASVTVPALAAAPAGAALPLRAKGCPAAADTTTFADAGHILALNQVMADFGARPTASPNHQRFVDWLEQKMLELPGVTTSSIEYQIDRWMETGSSLTVLGGPDGDYPVRASGAVPYALATGSAGVTAPLVYVPPEAAIDGSAAGKIVIRDFVATSIPNAAFAALEWWSYDPGLVLTRSIAGNYERDWLSAQRQIDLRAAKDSGAAGLVFVHGFPHDQVAGHYAPYDGIRWEIPSVYVGADEGAELKQAAASGLSSRLVLTADEGPASTRMLIATLPGLSDERIIVTSHTDGVNAVWDNGPISMIAIAEHFASVGRECRPRTIQFVFTTAHLFQALGGPGTHDGSSRLMAEQLDADYGKGTVAAVLAVEHMGARSYDPKPNPGHAGRIFVQSKLDEPTTFFFGESPALSAAVLASVVKHDLRETIALRGADLPAPHIPMHHSFGGEGGPYHQRLVPTIAHVTGPWTLFNPAFGMEALDKDKLYRQTLVFADIVHNLEVIPRNLLGGGYLAERAARQAFCSSAYGRALGLADCPSYATKPFVLGGAK